MFIGKKWFGLCRNGLPKICGQKIGQTTKFSVRSPWRKTFKHKRFHVFRIHFSFSFNFCYLKILIRTFGTWKTVKFSVVNGHGRTNQSAKLWVFSDERTNLQNLFDCPETDSDGRTDGRISFLSAENTASTVIFVWLEKKRLVI